MTLTERYMFLSNLTRKKTYLETIVFKLMGLGIFLVILCLSFLALFIAASIIMGIDYILTHYGGYGAIGIFSFIGIVYVLSPIEWID